MTGQGLVLGLYKPLLLLNLYQLPNIDSTANTELAEMLIPKSWEVVECTELFDLTFVVKF